MSRGEMECEQTLLDLVLARHELRYEAVAVVLRASGHLTIDNEA